MKTETNLTQNIDNICEQFYKDVYHYALYFTNSRDEAEDITQETFIKVLRLYKQLNDPSKLKTWILTIAKNIAIDYYRRKKIIEFIPDIFLSKEKAKNGLPENELQFKEDWQEVQQALLSLKPAYRNVIILRGIQELSISETSAILRCKESKVRVDYHRATKELQMLLSLSERGITPYESKS